jgi:hypothetical protein
MINEIRRLEKEEKDIENNLSTSMIEKLSLQQELDNVSIIK